MTILVSMLQTATSHAVASANASNAALPAEYGPRNGGTARVIPEPTQTRRPDSRSRMAGSGARFTRTAPTVFTSAREVERACARA
jgi:hypothetical protein